MYGWVEFCNVPHICFLLLNQILFCGHISLLLTFKAPWNPQKRVEAKTEVKIAKRVERGISIDAIYTPISNFPHNLLLCLSFIAATNKASLKTVEE